jgi:hypothetical protein
MVTNVSPEPENPSVGRLLLALLVLLGVQVSLGLLLDRLTALGSKSAAFVAIGLTALVISTGHPRVLLQAWSRMGEFQAIDSPVAVRWLLRLVGVACIIGGLVTAPSSFGN